jgi:Leucine-rich repeat (LRR) protein
MKLVFIFLLSWSSVAVLAQPVVLSLKQAQEKGVKFSNLFEEYNPGRKPGEPVVTEVPFSLTAYIESVYKEVIDSERLTDLSVWTNIYFGADGRVDYYIFRFPDPKMIGHEQVNPRLDSLSAIISEKLPRILERYRFSRSAGRKSTFHVFTGFGIVKAKPGKSTKDSTINSLDEALSARDTLKVKNLMLNRSLLTEVPAVIYRFPNLEVLNFTDNDIEQVNIDMHRLPKLRQLDLGRNLLTQDAIYLSKNKSLELLFLQKNLITDIPKAVRGCKGLKSLWLGYNRLTGINSSSFRKMRRLTDLNFYGAEITVLPKAIGKVKRLQLLDLYYNELTELPASITRLRKLTHLAISYNKIQTLPARIDKMKRIHTIYAHHNHLSKLPARMGRLKEVKILDLGYNWFSDFPDEIKGLKKLHELDLSSNNFNEFPTGLLNMRAVEKLFLRGNPFLKAGSIEKFTNQLTALKSKNAEVFD